MRVGSSLIDLVAEFVEYFGHILYCYFHVVQHVHARCRKLLQSESVYELEVEITLAVGLFSLEAFLIFQALSFL